MEASAGTDACTNKCDRCTPNRRPAQTLGTRVWPAVQVDHWFGLFRDVSRPVRGLKEPDRQQT